MAMSLVLTGLVAGFLILIGGARMAERAAPARWFVAAFVVLDTGILASSLFALPSVLPLTGN